MSIRFKYIPHTADVAFFAYGKTFKEALENAGLAMFNLMFDIKAMQKADGKIKKVTLTETAKNKKELVWYLLQKALSEVDADGMQVLDFKIKKITFKNKLYEAKCTVICKYTKEYLAKFDVKAVTPSELEVFEKKDYCRIKVVLDV